MSLGVMHDLAVGVHPGGADAWRLQDVYAQGVQVGAPPDPYNQLGQDWSQPPWRPDRLAELGYQPFRDLIGAVLRHAGGVRVDHVIGMFRLWWIPTGRPANEGTYVRYDHAALIGVLALEAHRAGAVVVGEDLGVVAAEAATSCGPRHPRHLDPVVRVRRRRRAAPRRALARVVPGLGHHPRPAAHRRLPRRRPGPAAAPARAAGGRPRRRARLGPGARRGLAGGGTPPRRARRRRRRSSRPCTATWRSPRPGCSASLSATRWATGGPRTSRAPRTSTPTGGSRWPARTAYRSRSKRSSRATAPGPWLGPLRPSTHGLLTQVQPVCHAARRTREDPLGGKARR